MKQSDFVIWMYKRANHACVLRDLKGIEKIFRLKNGTSLAADFPDKVSYHMHPDFPNDIQLLDNVRNSQRLIVASKPLCEFMQALSPPKVEFLPIKIVDHKGRAAKASYSIINPIDPVDCIDKDKSEFEPSPINPGSIFSIQKLVIDESRIPTDRVFFRMLGFWEATLVRRNLADAIAKQNFSGVGWLEIEDYPPA